jgi:hypothetical protein
LCVTPALQLAVQLRQSCLAWRGLQAALLLLLLRHVLLLPQLAVQLQQSCLAGGAMLLTWLPLLGLRLLLLLCSQLLLLVQCVMAAGDGLLIISLPRAIRQHRQVLQLLLLLLLMVVQQQSHVVLLVQRWRCISAEGHLAQTL